jgi:hypothetical protein
MNGADRAYGGAATPNDDSERLETSVDQIAALDPRFTKLVSAPIGARECNEGR